MNDLWERSIRQIHRGRVVEYGATIVFQKNGKLRLTNVVKGTAGEVAPLLHARQGQIVVGTFHTHPYVEGFTGVSFSGADFGSTINDHENLSLVQSGEEVFALVRTERTSSAVDIAIVEAAEDELVVQFIGDKLPFDEAVLRTNLELCAPYGLALYAGKSDGVLEVLFRP